MNFHGATGSPETHSETWYQIPYEGFIETRRITHAYAKFIGKLPITSKLPQRGVACINQPSNKSNVLLDYVEDLIETSLQDVPVPLSQIPHNPPKKNITLKAVKTQKLILSISWVNVETTRK
jgi:hypothetical protein